MAPHPPDPAAIEDTNYTNEKLQEIMTGYRENQAQAARMFQERKDGMLSGTNHFTPGDDNSKFYTKPDEAPISHPAEVLERLQKEKPDAPMEELVKEADEIVAQEVEERKKEREKDSTEAKLEEITEEGGEPEVSSSA